MSSRLPSDHWQSLYDQGKTGWDRGAINPLLADWVDTGELRACKILVPGCGRGHEVIYLAQLGFDVTAIDFASSAVDSLRHELDKRKLSARVVQADIFEFQPEALFDAVYEQTCLCAIHPEQWIAYEQCLASWLVAGGTLHALFMQSHKVDGPPFHCDLEEMKKLFASDRWCWRAYQKTAAHPAGMYEQARILQRIL